MRNTVIINTTKVVEQLSRFTAFVQHMDGQSGFIRFRDSSAFLGREEDYKSRIAEEAWKELELDKWDGSWIGTGKITERVKRAMNKSGNLVNKNQQIEFKNRLDSDHPKYRPEAEQVLYDIYRNPLCEESLAFENAIKTFGAKYDTIAFLFFVKDDTRFLPISTGHFDKGFAALDIDFSTSHRCSWENYHGFISIMKEIRTIMEGFLFMNGTSRLIDAHSFVWIIQQERYINWIPDTKQEIEIEKKVEGYIQSTVFGITCRRNTTSSVFIRSADVVKETRKRANGVCQYCKRPAPFMDKKGLPYLEVHHVIWLSRGGEDSIANTVALCPNCHTRMHILDKPEDVDKLQEVILSTVME